jgi:hypothetical protein
MKIFYALLGFLAIATRFDHAALASPTGVIVGRSGEVIQQRNDGGPGEILEKRQPSISPGNICAGVPFCHDDGN